MSNAKKKSSKKKTSAAKAPTAAANKKKSTSGPATASKKKSTKKKPSTAAASTGSATTRRKGETRYWLMKSEPGAYSITDLERDGREEWDGVRNYQARNFMRDEMAVGDEVLFYHSNATPSGVAGRARISREAAPDVTALDPESKYFDPKATNEEPRWYCVQVEHVETFAHTISLAQLKETKGLEEMAVLKRGQRLSIMPVTKQEYEIVRRLAAKTPAE